MTTLNPLAVANAPLLREISAPGRDDPLVWTISAIARQIGRDESNVRKTIKALASEGLIDADTRTLTDHGTAQLAAIDRAEGQGGGEPGSQPSAPADGMLALYHAQILPDPGNARRDWDSDEAKTDLDALREDLLLNGLLQNLVVRAAPADDLQGVSIERTDAGGARHTLPLYRLVGGERRWRAIAEAIRDGDWPEDRLIACRELDGDDLGCRLAALAENIQRRNLNPIEKARAFEGLAEAGLSNQQIADRIVATPEHVQQHRRFLQLDEADQTRMTLPKDDPRHLSVREARQKLARKQEVEEAWKPTSHPADEQLLIAEIAFAARDGGAYMGNLFAVGPDARQDPVAIRLANANIISLSDAPQPWGTLTGHFTAALKGWHLCDACRTAWPVLCGDDLAQRTEALAALQTELAGAPADGVTFLTPWLNAPFDLTPEGQAILDQQKAAADKRAADEAARQAERAAATERWAKARANHLALLNASAETPPADAAAVTTEAAAGIDHPLPWTLLTDGAIIDAEGAEVTSLGNYSGADEQDLAIGQIIVLSVNTAAGLPTPPIKSADEDEPEQDIDGNDPDADPDSEEFADDGDASEEAA